MIIEYKNIKFKQYKDFPNYFISSCGKVYSKKRNIILKFQIDSDGYLNVGLINNKQRKSFFVHRLVASVWIPNINNKPQINHIDGDKQNNNFENLEWVSNQENMNHAYTFLNIKKGGRPIGSKDNKKRKTHGYFERYIKIKEKIKNKKI